MIMNYVIFSGFLLISFVAFGMQDPFLAIKNLLFKQDQKDPVEKQELREAVHELQKYRAKRSAQNYKQPANPQQDAEVKNDN
jgi:hypothetical protein